MQTTTEGMKQYIVKQTFNLNIQTQNQEAPESFKLDPGDQLEFDGLYVNYGGIQGAARSLNKVIGEWIEPADGIVAEVDEPALSKHIRNDSIAEHSSGRRKIIIERSDDAEVARTRAASTSENNKDVVVKGEIRKKGSATVVVDEQRVAKKTDYQDAGTVEKSEKKETTKRAVIPEAESQQEVAKVLPTNRAKNAPVDSGVREVTSADQLQSDTIYDQRVVKTVSEDANPPARSEVGSSTQTKMAAKKASTVQMDQDAVVVGKTKTRVSSRSTDGIDVTTTVGASEEFEAPKAQVSGQNNESIILNKKEAKSKDKSSEESLQVNLEDVVFDGKPWPKLSWQAKVKMIEACDRVDVIEAIIDSNPTDKILSVANKRLKELKA